MQACIREIREELGIDLAVGALLCVDYNTSTIDYVESLMFHFAVEPLDPATVASITLDEHELAACEFVSLDDAITLLDPRVGRRLNAVCDPTHRNPYLENQRPLA